MSIRVSLFRHRSGFPIPEHSLKAALAACGNPGLEAKLTYSFNKSNRPTYEAATPFYYDLDYSGATLPSWDQRTNTGILDVSYEFDNGFKLQIGRAAGRERGEISEGGV